MSHSQILRRAWEITWKHKALWIFGFLVSLFGGSGGTSGGQGAQYTTGSGDWAGFPVWTVIILLLLFVVIMAVVGIVLRYTSVAALIHMVREVEETGSTSASSGWRGGFSKMLRLLGIDLVIGIPAVLVSMVLVGLGLAPLILLSLNRDATTVAAILLTVLAMLVVGVVLMVVWFALSLIGELARREGVLGGYGVLDSIRNGYRLGRQNLRPVLITWALVLVLGIVVGVVFIPIAVFVIGLAVAPAMAMYAATENVFGSVLLGLVLTLPGIALLSFLGGIHETYRSTVWTLTYRELPR